MINIQLTKSSTNNNARLWLKKIRLEKRFTQENVAKQCNISRPLYSQIEAGLKNPGHINAKKIAQLLGFDWTMFFENMDE